MTVEVVEERRTWESKHGAVLHEPTPGRPYYRIAYRTRLGQRKQLSAGKDEAKALAKLAEVEAELASGLGERGRQPMPELMAEFIAQVERDGGYTDKHKEALRRFVEPLLGDVPAFSLTRADIRDCLDAATAPATKRHLRASLGAMLTWAYATERVAQPREFYLPKLPNNAARGAGRRAGESHLFIDREKVPSVAAVQELAEYVRAARGGRAGVQAWLMVALSAGTGIRQGELLALRPSDFDFASGELHVRRQVVKREETLPKWGRRRSTIVPRRTLWGEPLEVVLRDHLDGVAPDALGFPAPQGGYWNPSNLRNRVTEPAMVACPLWDDAWTWHSLRHTFCTWMLGDEAQTGKSAAAVTDVMHAAGHRDSHTTLAMYVGRTAGGVSRLRDLT